ncbi:dihydroorotate dehydrogenase [Vulcanibacillus modesticaldus]|uniref:Dihydroorotate dehydrogenase n=1 Tax=Vulcanibacillus modesticaldus TaxID=337097 RepID=A0A1D2YT49_9BACI|nr:DUF2325 domain-containing protein [Vulcanibacillus modesticaldus]OEF98861.1 dihydroorotate dehydrogenase [Vulcanibacillus modesticaldus]
MSIVIVGGDHLGNIDKKLYRMGFQSILHIKGRKVSDIKKFIPKQTNVVLVLTDYVNHNLAKKVKERAKENSLPIYFSKRAWSSISTSLQDIKIS